MPRVGRRPRTRGPAPGHPTGRRRRGRHRSRPRFGTLGVAAIIAAALVAFGLGAALLSAMSARQDFGRAA